MILFVQPKLQTNSVNAVSKNTNPQKISFARIPEESDDFYYSNEIYDEDVEIKKISPQKVQLEGAVDKKYINLIFERENPCEKKLIAVNGEFYGENVSVDANFKKKSNKIFKGTYGKDNFELAFKTSFWGVPKIEGTINGKEYKAVFPEVKANDKNKNLLILLMTIAGNKSDIEFGNFDDLGASETCVRYFDYEYGIDNSDTLLNDVWEDPDGDTSGQLYI